MAVQPDKELVKLFERTKQVIDVSAIRKLASEFREISLPVGNDMLDKVDGIMSKMQVSVTVDNNGMKKRKYEAVVQESGDSQKETKVSKRDGAEASGEAAAASAVIADGWTCAQCTFLNHEDLEVCEICSTSRDAFALMQKEMQELKQELKQKASKEMQELKQELKQKASLEAPSTWLPVEPGTRLSKVTLAATDEDFMNVAKAMSKFGFNPAPSRYSLSSITNMFVSKPKSTGFTIRKVERIENLYLWQLYMIRKAQMEDENGPLVDNERTLWHGTTSDCVDSIATYGFNRSHCGKNGTAFGKGVYFSTGPCYSSNPRYATPDKSGFQYLFLSRVLTGRFTIGKEAMVEPPMDLTKRYRFNSLSNAMTRPDIFVIFHDAQTYPQFLVTFTTN